MTTSNALWQRQPQARVSLQRALDLFEAADRARNLSPRTVTWYRERLQPFFRHLEIQLGYEPLLGDLTIAAFRLFILEKQDSPKYSEHRFKRPTGEPPSPAHSTASSAPYGASPPGCSRKACCQPMSWHRSSCPSSWRRNCSH